MENEIIHKNKLIGDLTKSIVYWSDKNLKFMQAYTHMLHLFTSPQMVEEENVADEDEKTN